MSTITATVAVEDVDEQVDKMMRGKNRATRSRARSKTKTKAKK